MKKGFIFLIVFGTILLAAGGAMFGLAIAKGAFDNNVLMKEVTNEIVLDDSFNKIDIDIVTADLTFKPSEDGKAKVVSVEKEKIHHTAKVSNDALVIREQDDRKFYEKWFGFMGKMKVTVYLPETNYSDLKIKLVSGDTLVEDTFNFDKQYIKSTTGDIKLSNVTGASADFDVTTGKVVLTNYTLSGALNVKTTSGEGIFTNVTVDSASIHTVSGDQKYNSFIVNNNLVIHVTSGDIDFLNCDAATLNIHTTTGHVQGNLLTPKDFKAHSTTGDVTVYSTEGAPECVIETTTGDIYLTVGAK